MEGIPHYGKCHYCGAYCLMPKKNKYEKGLTALLRSDGAVLCPACQDKWQDMLPLEELQKLEAHQSDWTPPHWKCCSVCRKVELAHTPHVHSMIPPSDCDELFWFYHRVEV